MNQEKNLCVVFPGRRYSCDRSLLYYPSRYLQDRGYEMIYLHYDVPKEEKDMIPLSKNEEEACQKTEEVLSRVDFASYQNILFLGKSIGTYVSGKYRKEHQLDKTCSLLAITPLDETLIYLKDKDLIIAGEKDSYMMNTREKLQKYKNSHFLKTTTHSMEIKDNELASLDVVKEEMKIVEDYYHLFC